MSAKEILGVTGAAIGFFLGGPAGAALGATIGSTAGAYIDLANLPDQVVEGPRLGDLGVPTSDYGANIPEIRGTMRVGTNLIYADDIREEVTTTTTSSGGKGGSGPSTTTKTYTYHGTWGSLVCFTRNPQGVAGVKRIWFNGKLVYDGDKYTGGDTAAISAAFRDKMTVYKGDAAQIQDPILVSKLGAEQVPAFRGFCWIMFDDIELTEYGNRIPLVEVEVVADGSGDYPVIEGTAPLQSIITGLCEDVGLTESDIDVSQLSQRINWADTAVGSAYSKILTLATAYQFEIIQTGSKVRFMQHPAPIIRPEEAERCLINEHGLIVNAYHPEVGRNNYFNPVSGTSEGQLTMIKACCHAYQVTSAIDWKNRAELMAAALEPYLYKRTVPSVATDLFVPHWLFATKGSFNLQTYELNRRVTFTFDGATGWYKGTIPEGLHNWGELIGNVFGVYADDGTYPLWDNPYAGIIGTSYTVQQWQQTDGVGTEIWISGPTGTVIGVCIISLNIGPRLGQNESYEAWPVWRRLLPGELDCAADTLYWALDAYEKLFAITSDSKWSDALAATKQTIQDTHAVDDGRSWFKRAITGSAFNLSGSFESSQRSGMSTNNWYRDYGSGIIVGIVPQTTTIQDATLGLYSEAQIGRGVTDQWKVGDTSVQIKIGCSLTTTQVYVWIDTAITYGPNTRHYAALSLTAAATLSTQTISKVRTDFKAIFGNNSSPAVGATIYAVGISSFAPGAHRLYIESIRPLPVVALPYTPYVTPFTINTINHTIVDWRGAPGSGYQFPYGWHQIGVAAGAAGQATFLKDAQDQYNTDRGILGPLAHAYIWDRAEEQTLGSSDTWVYTWFDPNSKWGGYQYRPIESCARLTNTASSTTNAENVVKNFLNWLEANWASGNVPIFTDFPGDGPPQANYDEPHFVALAMRAAYWARLANYDAGVSSDAEAIISRGFAFLTRTYVTSGEMAGTWSNGPFTNLVANSTWDDGTDNLWIDEDSIVLVTDPSIEHKYAMRVNTTAPAKHDSASAGTTTNGTTLFIRALVNKDNLTSGTARIGIEIRNSSDTVLTTTYPLTVTFNSSQSGWFWLTAQYTVIDATADDVRVFADISSGAGTFDVAQVDIRGDNKSFASDDEEWYGFWHAEIIETLCVMLDEGSAITSLLGLSTSTINTWLAGSNTWLTAHTRSVVQITEDSLNSHNGDDIEASEIDQRYSRSRMLETDLPTEVGVKFYNPVKSYQVDVRYARRLSVPNNQSKMIISVPVSMYGDEATRMAYRILYAMWSQRIGFSYTQPPKFIQYEAGDAIPIVIEGQERTLFIVGSSFSPDGTLTYDTRLHDQDVYLDQALGGGEISTTVPELSKQGDMVLYLLDLPLLNESLGEPQLYYAVSGGDNWTSGGLYVSHDGGATYTLLEPVIGKNIVGVANTTLADGPTHVMDRVNTLNVTVANGTLGSIVLDTLLGVANSLLVGNEIIQFQDATLEVDGSYTLRNLLRGRKGTEHETGAHTTQETVIFLPDVNIYVDNLTYIGVQLDYKGVSGDQAVADVSAQQFTNTGNSIKPFSPYLMRATRDGSSNIDLTWFRRTRIGGVWKNNSDVSLGEIYEKFEIDVMNGTTVLRTLTATGPFTGQPTVQYTAADQTTDFGSAQSSVKFRIYQISDTYGRGEVLEDTV